jgi:hypothetical protein
MQKQKFGPPPHYLPPDIFIITRGATTLSFSQPQQVHQLIIKTWLPV